MGSVLKQTKPSAPGATGRRKRSAIPVPITISAVDKDGQSFREDSRTLVITRHGMMVETIHRLNLGAEITVENPALGRTSTGRVVWCGNEQSASQVNEIGIYLTDAGVLCGVELAPEDNKQRPADKPEGHRPENHFADASAQPDTPGAPKQAAAPGAVPAEPLVRNPANGVKPLACRAEEAHVQELDLTPELGQVEAVSRGLNSPAFPVLDELPEANVEPGGPTQETFALPPITPVGAPAETRLAVEQLNSAAEASLSLLEHRTGEIAHVQFAQFEQKLEVLGQRSVSLVEARLQESVAALEPKVADLVEKETASLRDCLRGAHVEVEGLLTRLEDLREQVHTNLPASVAREEEEYAAELELRMEGTLARHLAAAEDRLQSSRAAAESLLGQIEELRPKVNGNLQEWAVRPAPEISALVEQSVKAAIEQHMSSLGETLQNSRAEVDGLLVRVEEQRQRAQAGLQESASRLEEESAARLEQRITAALDQQLASVAHRLQGAPAEVDGWLNRVEEARQQAHGSLQEATARLEADSGARLEQKITATLEPQLASAAGRLQSAQAAVESLLVHVEETGRQIQGSLQGFVAEIEEKATLSLQHHLTVVDERLQRERLEAESLRVQLEQAGQEVRSSVQESATRLEHESAARLEERMRLSLDQQMASVLDRLQGSRVELEASLTRLQEAHHQIHTGLEESANRLEQRIAESLGQQLVAAREGLQGARLEAESAQARLEELRQKSHAALQESVATWEGESAARLEGRMAASLEQHAASAEDRLQSRRTELEGLLTKLEDSRESAQQKLQQSVAQLQEGVAALVEAQMASLGERLQGARADVEALLARLEESRRQAEVNLSESVTRLQENTTASLERHATEAAKCLQSSRTELESMIAGLEETRGQVRQDLQDSAAQLEQRVNAFVDQQLVTVENRAAGMRADAEGLLARLEQLQQVGETEITKARATLHELGSQTVQFALEGVNERLETDGERMLAQFRSRSAETVESECYTLSQRVSSASDFIRDWSQQAAARLSSYSERIEARAAASAESRQKQSEQIAAGFAEKLQNDADVVLSEALDRVQQTAALLENTTVAALQARVQKGTQDLVETTAAELRHLARENLDLVSKQLAERQQQFTGEISAALRRTFDELVEASSARVQKLTDDSLNLITDQLATRQKLLIDDTTKAFRHKVGEILVMLQNGSGENGSS